ncbi:peptidase M20 domain-containing protein 2-like isoform X2 [Paramacrobiotus metropolitanus]|uniref:peptidase M20 domain-containing protein 2-like isoform X2 n=1 Tax=Paramacrobiotus metropolitanus TaxID=2943436 RepID=UPI002445B2D2|nr:peptidase M20 domain-containing protein 2-like isoform X2 [Paramacrobiotus metropolitanus]
MEASLFAQMISESLAKNKEEFNNLSQLIWAHPETQYDEHFAHALLTDFLSKEGFVVEKAYAGVPTAFRAEIATSDYVVGSHPVIAILCEYDALPEIGHACGHNLIAEVGIAAGCAVRDVLLSNSQTKFPGKVVVLGCPAEEGGGGKIDLINFGCFRDIDFVMMAHPFPHDVLHCITLGIERCTVEFFGRATHASCQPWEGVNALDAAISAYNAVSLSRQQMKPDWRAHAIIAKGGTVPNVIPDHSESQYYMRCQNMEDMAILKSKLIQCFECAAEATGCRMVLSWDPKPYLPLRSNRTMASTFGDFAQAENLVYGPDPGLHGSSDIGNVSMVVPTIHPRFFVGESHLIHTREFQKLAGSSKTQPYCLRMAKIMALTAVELFINKSLREKVTREFDGC